MKTDNIPATTNLPVEISDAASQGAIAVIRPRKNRVEDCPYDKEMYNVVML